MAVDRLGYWLRFNRRCWCFRSVVLRFAGDVWVLVQRLLGGFEGRWSQHGTVGSDGEGEALVDRDWFGSGSDLVALLFG